MIISCPQCRTRYEVADQAIGDRGRSVQCAQCGAAWYADRSSALASLPPPRPKPASVTAGPASAADEDALDVEFEEIAASAPDDSAGPQANARMRVLARRQRAIARALPAARARRSFSAVAVALALSVIVGLVMAREAIVRAVPDLASFYGAVGLPVNVEGLVFGDVRTLRATEEGRDMLIVRGEIINVTPDTKPLPPVRVSLYRDDGTGIYEWQATAGAPALEAGGALAFETRLMAPPGDVARVKLRFEPGQAGNAGLVRAETAGGG